MEKSKFLIEIESLENEEMKVNVIIEGDKREIGQALFDTIDKLSKNKDTKEITDTFLECIAVDGLESEDLEDGEQ